MSRSKAKQSRPKPYSRPTGRPNGMDKNDEIPNVVACIDYKVGETVWAKIKGSPHWPAKIKALPSSTKAIVVWFNDYRITKIYKTQMYKFIIHFDQFSKQFDEKVGLRVAAEEALRYYGTTQVLNK